LVVEEPSHAMDPVPIVIDVDENRNNGEKRGIRRRYPLPTQKPKLIISWATKEGSSIQAEEPIPIPNSRQQEDPTTSPGNPIVKDKEDNNSHTTRRELVRMRIGCKKGFQSLWWLHIWWKI